MSCSKPNSQGTKSDISACHGYMISKHICTLYVIKRDQFAIVHIMNEGRAKMGHVERLISNAVCLHVLITRQYILMEFYPRVSNIPK